MVIEAEALPAPAEIATEPAAAPMQVEVEPDPYAEPGEDFAPAGEWRRP
jgi:hypothetical protein